MKRLLLDTNIYGELIWDPEYIKLKNEIKGKFVIHGFKVIRDELRDFPKLVKVEGKNLRVGLLHIYDELISNSYVVTDVMKKLRDGYYEVYCKLGGSKGYEKMCNDLLIVACATVYQIDIVVSEDNKSMLTENALKAYDLVNGLEKKKTPSFIGYLEFKRLLI